MGITIELLNLGKAEPCREITVQLEHAFSSRQGAWHVPISGSRAADHWDLRVEGPHGFERSYSLSGSAAEHEPAVICAIVLKTRASTSIVTAFGRHVQYFPAFRYNVVRTKGAPWQRRKSTPSTGSSTALSLLPSL